MKTIIRNIFMPAAALQQTGDSRSATAGCMNSRLLSYKQVKNIHG
jgi:hypothetical protein